MYPQGLPVAFRTRSYKKQNVVGSDLITCRKRKRVDDNDDDDDDDVVLVRVNLEGEGGSNGKVDSGFGAPSSSHSGLKGERVSEFVGESANEPIDIDDSDNDDDGSVDEEGLRPSEKGVEVNEEWGSEESKGCSVFADKVENFGDHRGSGGPEDPILFDSDGDSTSEEEVEEEEEEDNVAGSSLDDDGYGFLLSQSESEDANTSDEDFQVDDKSEYSSSEDNDSLCEDHRGRCRKTVKEWVRKVECEADRRGVWTIRKGERKDNELGEESEEQLMGADCASATSSKSEICKDEAKRVETVNAGAEVFGDRWESSGCSITAEAKGTEDKKRGRGHHSDNANDSVSLDNEGKEHHHDKGTCMRSVSVLPKSQEKAGDSARVVIKEVKRVRPQKDWFNGNDREKKVSVVDDEIGYEYHEVLRMPSRTKVRGFEFFTECFWGKHDSDTGASNVLEEKNCRHDSDKDGSHVLEEKDKDVCHEGQTQPLACSEAIPLNWNSSKEEPIEKSESEKELETLWGELDMVLRGEEIGSQVGNTGTNEARENEETPALHCKHDTIFDEQIGIYCRWCGWIATEIKYIMPPFVDSERTGKRVSSGGVNNTSQFDGDLFNDSSKDSESEADLSLNDGTVWDLIPDKKPSLYPHQQEGFEFIWKNLAGTTNLAELKKVDPNSEGGCIISHAPGTGKTKLTMVFLETYLQVFPKCQPVIIAPANILLTWEDELRKWNIGIPFHNLNNADLSGKELGINEIDWSGNQRQNIRMLKLCSWYKEKSILLISYNLYEKLAGGKSEVDREKEKKNRKKEEKKRARTREKKESAMGKVLREYPGLLVLDEGHTPRNQKSCIWKVLSESRSQKRILLSGTPFQNNFLELYNILCLMKPSFPDSIPQKLKKFCQSRLMQEKKSSKDFSWEPDCSGNSADEKIKQLKLLMNPFVNVHKGSILQKNLPGLRDCVLVLKPDSLQQETLDSIECSQNVLNFEHKLALVSVHPSLFLNCSLSKQEESVVDKDKLENLRLNPYGGVKTKFLIEFIRLCDAVNEKVLVFSQFIDTLSLIKDQLESAFNWSVGKEVLYFYGKLDHKQKQSLIHSFNDANSQAKVMLASIKASSEGINLIGASRVVLLDVVWNPSVERQAISRAYRLGQKRVVYTYHLLAQGTPECTKYCKQAEKNRLSELVFSNRNAETDKVKNRGVKFEDRILDIMVQHEKLKGMFGERLDQSLKMIL